MRFGGWAKSVVVLVVLASALTGRARASGPEALVGAGAERLANGHWSVHLADGSTLLTHGPDPRPGHGGSIGAGDPERAPVCSTDYYQHVLYGRNSGSPDRSSTVKASIQAAIRRINAVLNEESLESGARTADYKVKCDGNGAIAVDSFTAPTYDFNSVVSAARAAGFTLPNVDYTIFYDYQPPDYCGIGSYLDDESSAASNANNGGGGYAIAYNLCWDGDTPMHENGHNQGAVQYGAPNSTGSGGHCYDENDVMCYSPDGGDLRQGGTISRCTDHIHFDCGNDDYFDALPESGEYLASHWNIGSTVNRFIVFGASNGNPTAAMLISCQGYVCSFTDASTDNGSVTAWTWTFGDGGTSTLRNPTHTYAAAGTFTVGLTVTDDEGKTGSTSRALTVDAGANTDPDPATPTLENGKPRQSQRSGGLGEWRYFKIYVPAGRPDLRVNVAGPPCQALVVCVPDLDLYVRRGLKPATSSFDCRSWDGGNTEACTIASPATGWWYVGVFNSLGLPSQAGNLSGGLFTVTGRY